VLGWLGGVGAVTVGAGGTVRGAGCVALALLPEPLAEGVVGFTGGVAV
jgi:hypothetical protein